MKCGEWNEIRLDAFLDILEMYKSNRFKDKILEITGLTDLKLTGYPASMFFGKSINVYEDFTEFSEKVLKSLEQIDRKTIEQDIQFTSCIISGGEYIDVEPIITPILGQDHYDLLTWSWLDGKITANIKKLVDMTVMMRKQRPPQFWYYKKENRKLKYVSPVDRVLEDFEKKNKNYKKYVSVRVVDHEFFKSIVSEYINTGGNINNEFLGPNFPKERNIHLIKD